ncbi:MAG: hypothetical protein ACRCTA_05460, partial [Bacilli bacterium]
MKIQVLKDLVQLNSIASNEYEVRDYLINYLRSSKFKTSIDEVGNLIINPVHLKQQPHIVVVAHMDEVGFMIQEFHNDLIKLYPIGNVQYQNNDLVQVKTFDHQTYMGHLSVKEEGVYLNIDKASNLEIGN